MSGVSASPTGEFQILSGEEVLRRLGDSGLFTHAEIQAILKASPGNVSPAEGEALIERLTAEGRLTPFQAAAIRERRFDELVLDDYEVLDRLGAGGMGTVYKARHRRMKRLVAVKVLSAKVAQSEHFVQRFQREVEAAARLSHPNVVMAFDAGEARAGHFLVMEFVDGRDLATEVAKHGALPPRTAVDCVVQAARALEYAHAQGVIHRDIKPANLLRNAHGVVKVADLGLARIHDPVGAAGTSGLTQAGTIMGTVDFMSPEQAMAAAVDPRTDIYSLGCTLFFLIAGRPPYQGATLMAILLQHREAPIPSLAESGWTIPDALNTAFQRMVAKKAEDRYPSMTEVLRALAAIELPQQTEPPQRVAGLGAAVDLNAPTVGAMTVTEQAPQPAAGPPPGRPEVAGLRVLLAEPSRTQSVIIRKYFQECGIADVPTAASGRQALELARRIVPQAVVSAMHLPDMTGPQLAQQLAADPATGQAGFVLITSEADSAVAGQSGVSTPLVHLRKPFDADGLARALDQAARPSVSAGKADPASFKVLIVDDSPTARRHIRDVLSGLGFSRFTDAADGSAAIALLGTESFDLVVTDYNMPGADGRAVVEYIRRGRSNVSLPVLMVTTETDPGRLEAVRKLGVSAILDKHFRVDEVRAALDAMLRRNA
jgi:serine/threonine-protein kinase